MRSRDVRRLRRVAEITAGKCATSSRWAAYRLPWLDRTPGSTTRLVCRAGREDAELVTDPAIDDKGFRIVRTEQAVFAAHPRAAHFRYPYLYGPYQPAPREWSIVRRIRDGRRASSSRTRGSRSTTTATPRTRPRAGAAIEHPERRPEHLQCRGREALTVRQVVELCARELGADLEIVSMPYDLAVPAWPLLAQPLPTHRVLDVGRLHTSSVTATSSRRACVRRTARWLAENPPARGGIEDRC